jgi:hypothetical protein
VKANRKLFVALGSVAVMGAVVGFALGKTTAPTVEEADAAKAASSKTAFEASFSNGFSSTVPRGRRAGVKRGVKAGRALGSRLGETQGISGAEAQLAAIAAAEAEAAEQAALAEAAEREANCGAPLFSTSYCPSDSEIAYENNAETLCGGGRYDEAAALGISCYPGHLP